LQVDHCVELETWPLSRRFDHPKDYTYYSGIDDVGQIGRLVDGASDDVVVGYGCGLRGIVPVLFTDDIEDRLRDVQQDILQADHVAGIGKGGLVSTELYGGFYILQVLRAQTLHPYCLVVAHVVVEGIRLATEVVHDALRAQGGHHLGVVPGEAQVVVGNLSAGHRGRG